MTSKGRILALAHRLAARELVTAAYAGLLEREPDVGALAEYGKQLASTGDAASLLRAVSRSDEHWHRLVERRADELVHAAYRGILGRDADAEGLERYRERLARTRDLTALLNAVWSSQESHERSIRAHADRVVDGMLAGLTGGEQRLTPEMAASLASSDGDVASLARAVAGLPSVRAQHFRTFAREIAAAWHEADLGPAPSEDELSALTRAGDIPSLLRALWSSPESHERSIRAHAERVADGMLAGLTGGNQRLTPEMAATLTPSDNDVASLARAVACLPAVRAHLFRGFAREIAAGLHKGVLGSDAPEEELSALTAALESPAAIAPVVSRLLQSLVRVVGRPAPSSPPDRAVKHLKDLASNDVDLVLLNGVHGIEGGKFVWCEPESAIILAAGRTLYFGCNYLGPRQSRRIEVFDGTHQTVITLTDPYACHELHVGATSPKHLRFVADGHFVPRDAGINSDSRSLAFQLWFQRPLTHHIGNRPRRPASPTRIISVHTSKKEADSLRPVHERLARMGRAGPLLKANEVASYLRETRVSSPLFLVASADAYTHLQDCDVQGHFIYLEHGASPIKRYTYYPHYARYDLSLLPGDLWTDRARRLYPEALGEFHAVGYPKLVARHYSALERETACKKLGLDPTGRIILFAPSWSGGDRSCGLFNLRHLSLSANVFAIPHDGDVTFAPELRQEGYRVHVLDFSESISDYYGLADCLVSDISSTAVEFAALGKPVICIRTHRIPDYEMRFAGESSCIGIPHTDRRWDFCDVVSPDQIGAAVDELLQTAPMHPSQSQEWRDSVRDMLACYGQESVDRCVQHILDYAGANQ